MTFLSLVAANLRRRPVRNVLALSGVAVGVAAGLGICSIAWGFDESIERALNDKNIDLTAARITSRSPIPASFDDRWARKIAELPEVVDVSAMLSDLIQIEDGAMLVVRGIATDSFAWEATEWIGDTVVAPAEGGLYLGEMAAKALQKKVGDFVRIDEQKVPVLGIFRSRSHTESGTGMMSLESMQKLLDADGKINFIDIRLQSPISPEGVGRVEESIERRFRGLKVFRTSELSSQNLGVQLVKAMSLATVTMAFVMCAFSVANTLLIGVMERVQEIGLLLAVGWQKSSIAILILAESLVIAGGGAVLGSLLGFLAVKVLEQLPWAKGKIFGYFSPELFLAAFVLVLVLGVLSSLYPTLRACSMRPRDALLSDT